jgi:DNA replication and repair protein RecF
MIVSQLWLIDFRNHVSTELELHPGVTLITGQNGHGKTNLLEGLSLLNGHKSFRGANSESLVKSGCEFAVIRAQIVRHDREHLIEMKIVASGRSRVQLNRQAVKRFKDLSDTVSIVVFSPDDLELIKGSPAIRRNYIDEILLSCDKKYRQVKTNFDRVIKQRNNLLKQGRGRLTKDLEASLSIWNSQFVELSKVISKSRTELVRDIEPLVDTFYSQVAGKDEQVKFRYETTWMDKGLDKALDEVKHEELRRGTTLVGPHRDDVIIDLNELVSRTHSSQGEQRSLALALRLSEHSYVAQKINDSPLILLDDVFSELDEGRSKRLVECLPSAQIILTSATGTIPVGINPGKILKVLNGNVSLGEHG